MPRLLWRGGHPVLTLLAWLAPLPAADARANAGLPMPPGRLRLGAAIYWRRASRSKA